MFNREPALILAAVQAGVALLVSFGFDLTVEQVGAVVAFTAAALGAVTRSKVTPVEEQS